MNESHTYLQKQSQLVIISHLELSEDGLIKDQSDASGHLEEKDSTTVKTSRKSLLTKKDKIQQEKESSMQESAPIIKKKISKDKSTSSKQSIQMTQSSKILDQDSIGKEKVLKPFWNQSTMEISQKLWCPTKIDCVDSDSSSLNGSVKSSILKSWFSTLYQRHKKVKLLKVKTEQRNYQKIYSQLSQSLLQKTMVTEQQETEKSEKFKAKKIRMKPTKEQKQKLLKWFGIYRFVYNKGLTMLNNRETDKTKNLKKQLDEKCVKNSVYETENKWVNELPADTRGYAIRELIKNFMTNINSEKHFEMKYKSRKNNVSIQIRQRQYYQKRGQYLFLSQIKKTEPIEATSHELKIQMEDNDHFYLVLTKDLIRRDNQSPEKIISLDPGIRTFLTGYSTDENIFHIGKDDIGRLSRLIYYKNKLQGKIKKAKKNKCRLKKAFKRMSRKLKDLVDDAHKKIVKWLLENFSIIVIPKLDTNSFCRKNMSRIVKNKIKAWRYCSFLDRLRFKNQEYPNVKIIIPTEEFTSKTCSNCGNIHWLLGKNKEFHCPSCDIVFDRDVNAAKNILLKTISERDYCSNE